MLLLAGEMTLPAVPSHCVAFAVELGGLWRRLWVCSYPSIFLADNFWLKPVWSLAP